MNEILDWQANKRYMVPRSADDRASRRRDLTAFLVSFGCLYLKCYRHFEQLQRLVACAWAVDGS